MTNTADASTEVTLINVFEVDAADTPRFLERWRNNADIMATASGFIDATMHRALEDDTRFRFVNVARWESRDAWARAIADPRFRASTRALIADPELRVRAHPALYDAVESYPR